MSTAVGRAPGLDDVQRDADRLALRHPVARGAEAHRRVVVVGDDGIVEGRAAGSVAVAGQPPALVLAR